MTRLSSNRDRPSEEKRNSLVVFVDCNPSTVPFRRRLPAWTEKEGGVAYGSCMNIMVKILWWDRSVNGLFLAMHFRLPSWALFLARREERGSALSE
mmetsp:Transcript_4037/g.8710  ORF Transcript_4037/g.8710 Transcript_4037/m.8710 type:complete len:96 (+) Transcript_4037:2375-2662(+)